MLLPLIAASLIFSGSAAAADSLDDIDFVYEDVLGRPAGPAEKAYWKSTGLSGDALRDTVVSSASGSDRAAVERYLAAQKGMPQNPDPAVKAALLQAKKDGIAARKAMERGEDVSALAKKYLPDADKSKLLDHEAAISQLYRDVLGREPDAAGLAYWKKQVESGAMSYEQVKAAMANSAEGKGNQNSKVSSAI